MHICEADVQGQPEGGSSSAFTSFSEKMWWSSGKGTRAFLRSDHGFSHLIPLPLLTVFFVLVCFSGLSGTGYLYAVWVLKQSMS